MSLLGEDEEQTGSYSIYFAEGEALAKQQQFAKAIESFTKASLGGAGTRFPPGRLAVGAREACLRKTEGKSLPHKTVLKPATRSSYSCYRG